MSGEWGVCARVASEKAIGKAGWRYEVSQGLGPITPVRSQDYIHPGEARKHWYYSRQELTPERLTDLAVELGVDDWALRDVGYGYDPYTEAYTVPFRTAKGRIVGVQYRTGTAKWALKGSRLGLFIPGPHSKRDEELLVSPEGASDTAALWAMGFCAIGRPSCRLGGDALREYIASHPRWTRGPAAVIVADNDAHGAGLEGALEVAWDIPYSCVVIPKDHKDARQVLTAGGDRGDFLRCIDEGVSVYWRLVDDPTQPNRYSPR